VTTPPPAGDGYGGFVLNTFVDHEPKGDAFAEALAAAVIGDVEADARIHEDDSVTRRGIIMIRRGIRIYLRLARIVERREQADRAPLVVDVQHRRMMRISDASAQVSGGGTGRRLLSQPTSDTDTEG
jgi:hypothetical protein